MIRVFATILSLLLNLLPRRVTLAMGNVAGILWFDIVRFRRNVALENLRIAFGSEWDEAKLIKVARQNFCHYGNFFFDVLLSVSWSRDKVMKRGCIDNLETFEKALAQGKGVYLLGTHVGSWEMSVQLMGAFGLPIDFVVKRSATASIQRFLEWHRTRFGLGLFFETGTAGDILRSTGSGRGVVCVLDQFMGPPIGLPVTFFGREAGTAVALALFTEKRDVPVIPFSTPRDESGKVHLVFHEPVTVPHLSDDRNSRLYERTQAYNDAIERIIRNCPEQWLWIHRRWKAYRGEPRWKPKLALASLFLAASLHLTSCSSQKVESTYIPLPADAEVSVPVVEATPTDPVNEPIFEIKLAPVAVEKKKRKIRGAAKSPIQEKVVAARIPFEVGERMVLEASWAALTAGRGTLEVRRGEPFNGRPTLWLWGNVLSSRLVDAIYHVDNTVESFVDAVGLFPYKFLLHMVESKQLKETKVLFDHPKAIAHYAAKRISERWGNTNDSRQDKIVPLSKDLFSAFYYARMMDFELGKQVDFPVYENNQNFRVELKPVANELVISKVGAFQTWKVLANILVNNDLKQTGDIFVWFSDDSKRYLVKLDAQIKIGSLKANLVELRERL